MTLAQASAALPGLSFRPIEDDDGDREFLCRLYASTREEELAAAPWEPAEKEAFLRMQFEAQHRHYQEHFAQAEFSIILEEDRPIGRLYVDRREDEIRLIDIALVPECRNRGRGGGLMKALIEEARQAGQPLRIHVEQFNPARRLYERLGFHMIEDKGVYHLMEWTPENEEGTREEPQ